MKTLIRQNVTSDQNAASDLGLTSELFAYVPQKGCLGLIIWVNLLPLLGLEARKMTLLHANSKGSDHLDIHAV